MSMKIIVNGAPRDVPEGLNIASLIESLGIPGDRVAIERNQRIVRKAEWTATVVQAGDSIEVVTFVGGGSV